MEEAIADKVAAETAAAEKEAADEAAPEKAAAKMEAANRAVVVADKSADSKDVERPFGHAVSMGPALDHKTMVARRLRENKWKDQMAYETEVVQPYLAVYNAPPIEWLRILHTRSEVVTKTNVDLQNRLATQEKVLRSLQKECDLRSQDMEHMRGKLKEGKDRQAKALTQLHELRAARVREERSLREQTVVLRDKVIALTEKQRRLEVQKRDDERRVSKNLELLEELRFMQAKLQLRKAEFEYDHEDNFHGGAGDRGLGTVCSESELGDPPRDDPEPDSIPRGSVDSQGFPGSRSETPFSMPGRQTSRPMTPMFLDDDLRATPPVGRMSPTMHGRSSPPPHGRSSPPPQRASSAHGRSPPPSSSTPPPGMVQACTMCGNILLPDAIFCRKCGKKRDPAACACGNVLLPDAIFCRKCGRRCRDEEAPSLPTSPSSALPAV